MHFRAPSPHLCREFPTWQLFVRASEQNHPFYISLQHSPPRWRTDISYYFTIKLGIDYWVNEVTLCFCVIYSFIQKYTSIQKFNYLTKEHFQQKCIKLKVTVKTFRMITVLKRCRSFELSIPQRIVGGNNHVSTQILSSTTIFSCDNNNKCYFRILEWFLVDHVTLIWSWIHSIVFV